MILLRWMTDLETFFFGFPVTDDYMVTRGNDFYNDAAIYERRRYINNAIRGLIPAVVIFFLFL
jgi:hypothetical protein